MRSKKIRNFFEKINREGMLFDVNGKEKELIKSLEGLSHRDLVIWLSEQIKILWLILEYKGISLKKCVEFAEKNENFITNNIESKLTGILTSLLS
ncbi:MAG: hypothetical protein ACFFAN_01230 [Promethearchaeota archaeon]